MTPRNSKIIGAWPQALRGSGFGAHLLRAALAALAVIGCARYRYVYGPPRQPPAPQTGWPSSRHEIAGGEVETSSLGVVAVSADEATAGSPALHVRMVVRNRDDQEPLRFDTRKQLAYVPGAGASAPTVIDAEAFEVIVPRGEAKTVDLYYPVARGYTADLPGFELAWEITGVASGRTAFVRLLVVPQAVPIVIPFGPPFGFVGAANAPSRVP
jgi:hypothetical protein